MTYLKSIAVAVIVLLHVNTFAQQNNQETGLPFMAHSHDFFMCMFDVPFQVLKAYLPEGIEAKVNENGSVRAGYEVYSVDQIVGFPAYTAAFFFVEIKGFDNDKGGAGHYPIWGAIKEKGAAKSFNELLGLPFVHSGNIDLKIDGDNFSSHIKTEKGSSVSFTVQKSSTSFQDQGKVNICSVKGADVHVTEVPWFSNGSLGTNPQIHVEGAEVPVLKLFEHVKPDWSMISTDQTFTYTQIFKKD